MNDFLPYAKPDIGEAEIAAAVEVLRSGWLTTGPSAAAFEAEFASATGGAVTALAVNSATAGLHLALEALGVGPGDEVVIPTWTFTATAEVVRYLGARPVIVDVDRSTVNLDVEAMTAAITQRTKAVIVVHIAGHSMDMKRVRRSLPDHVRLVEDAAHAFPSRCGEVVVGSTDWSDVAVFSFYANKTMTTGEGGMVTTTNPELARRIRTMRLHGIDRDVFDRYRSKKPAWFYDVIAPGYKYNLPDAAAAIGRVQLSRAESMRARREEIACAYREAMAEMPIELPAYGCADDVHAWHIFMIRVRHGANVGRDELVRRLSRLGIGTSVHFIPLHRHTYWRTSLNLSADDYPVAEDVFPRVVSLPIFSLMTNADVDRVVSALSISLRP